MKSIALLPLFVVMTGLSACGLRGDLERPAPILGEPSAGDPPAAVLSGEEDEDDLFDSDDDEATLRQRTQPERLAGTSYRDPETGTTYWVQNEGGGVKPLPSPTTDLEEGDLPPPVESRQ
ncbi:MAG: hypothetical protein CMK07_05555 [Ponticaulis sp.]|nr:hypothetical protein [Ponticaulis sp.]